MNDTSSDTDFEVVAKIVSLLQDMEKEQQIHILKTVNMWLKISNYTIYEDHVSPQKTQISRFPEISESELPRFSDREVMPPKDFLIERDPRTDVERVACLGYYLTNYREMPHFKTLDISKLNTEAAQPKFTNAAVAVKNATNSGLLASVSRGKKQLSAMGEQFVQALPDREEAMAFLRRKRKKRTRKPMRKRKTSKKVNTE